MDHATGRNIARRAIGSGDCEEAAQEITLCCRKWDEDLELKKGKMLPIPKQISPEEIRRVFEDAGFATVVSKTIGIDVYDILAPLLQVLQFVQWWGSICEINQFSLPTIEGELRTLGIAIHAADKGQQMPYLACGSVADALNMTKGYVDCLRRYGKDPGLRAERLDDADFTQLQNEHLDQIGETILRLFALALTPLPVDPKN